MVVRLCTVCVVYQIWLSVKKYNAYVDVSSFVHDFEMGFRSEHK